MPNWCYTRFIFHGNKTEIEDFHSKLTDFTSKNYINNGFGTNWLGNILCGAGLRDCIDSKEPARYIRCRGSIEYIEDVETFEDGNEALLVVDTTTAWVPMVKMWVKVIEALKYESISFSYQAEEPGLELYQIYDPFGDFPDRYYVDSYFRDIIDAEAFETFDRCRYYASDEDLRTTLQAILQTEETDLDILIRQIEGYKFNSEDSYVRVYKYDILEEDCWED